MNQETIPDNNLPVYVQQYEVNILNIDNPQCLIGGCQGTEFGCCCDKITPAIDASGSNCIGGCCGTQFGCCPYSTEAKVDREGSNCGTIAGSVLYTTVGAIPSNQVSDRVWDLNLTGYLKPNTDKYYIVYDFSEVKYPDKDKFSFQDKLSGTFNVCGRVLDASKFVDYKFCDAKLTLTIIIDTKKWDFRLKKEVLFSYQLNISDNDCPDCGSCQEFLIIYPKIKLSTIVNEVCCGAFWIEDSYPESPYCYDELLLPDTAFIVKASVVSGDVATITITDTSNNTSTVYNQAANSTLQFGVFLFKFGEINTSDGTFTLTIDFE